MSADTAPAAIPGEEDVARLLFEFATCSDLSKGPAALDTNAHSFARAILDLFAPILAEKENLAQCWEKECEERTAIGKMALDRALAAEAALAAERERLAVVAEDVCATPPTDFAGMELEAFHRGADAMNEAIAAAIRAQGE